MSFSCILFLRVDMSKEFKSLAKNLFIVPSHSSIVIWSNVAFLKYELIKYYSLNIKVYRMRYYECPSNLLNGWGTKTSVKC